MVPRVCYTISALSPACAISLRNPYAIKVKQDTNAFPQLPLSPLNIPLASRSCTLANAQLRWLISLCLFNALLHRCWWQAQSLSGERHREALQCGQCKRLGSSLGRWCIRGCWELWSVSGFNGGLSLDYWTRISACVLINSRGKKRPGVWLWVTKLPLKILLKSLMF